MTPSDLLKFYGTKTAIARAIGTQKQAVHGWFLRDTVPLEAQTKFEVATNGKLRADVSPEFRRVVRGRAA